MDKLKSMQVFVSVVEHGSFRSAANYFDMSATMVGKHIQFLESSLETRLLNRTTRKQSLTESGQIYYEECKRIIEDIVDAENRIQMLENTPMGTIKVNCPVTLGSELLAPIVADFLQEYPLLDVEMTLDNSLIDPFQSDADILLRIGELNDSTLIARKLGYYNLCFCASTAYLANQGKPDELEDLKGHSCLGFVYSQGQTMQSFKLSTDAFSKRNSRLASNNGHALRAAALNGAGIILQPRILVCKDIEFGALEEVLAEFTPIAKPIHLVYRSRTLSLKNRTFLDFVLKNLSTNNQLD
ncbi:LysR family transcriptional regulator [Shewanella sp. GutDb-MelDb]|uniref:LysR family transcriptional regulator n=1 Tax=Shewanella sp. GutDb-MelDb TaxID=2058316 RepID=UPI000C7C7BAD|nr:LysR family transcriptional regulator [Shewanella sp. GutDb-MelDb]PKG56460.1 LysR family transcriptional regulator [Shewanella sp. GutDb-MelDb]